MGKDQIGLFVPCLVDAFYPAVGIAVVTVFDRLGVTLKIPVNQTCCGQAPYNAGYRSAARTAARRFIRIFEGFRAIVSPSGSCVHMVKHHYQNLFDDDLHWQRRAAEVSGKIFEFTQYLVDILSTEDLGSAYAGVVTLHDSCHLFYGLGIEDQPRKLLNCIKGLRLAEMPDSSRCCGFGGAFSVKYAQISAAMLEDKVKAIIDSGADTVTGCDIGCLMHMEGMIRRRKLPIKVRHIAQLLAAQ